MKQSIFTRLWLRHILKPLLLTILMLMPSAGWGESDTFEFDGLTVTTDGVEGTDYLKEDRTFRILSDKDFTFSAKSTVVRIVVDEGLQNAHFTLDGYNCDRGTERIGGPVIFEKNSSARITLAEGTTNILTGSLETETMLIGDGVSVTIDGTGSLTVNSSRAGSAGHGAPIQLNKTATLTINSGTVTAISTNSNKGEGAAIGCPQYGQDTGCGTLIINGGDVYLTSGGRAAAFGGGSNCPYTKEYNGSDGGTLIVNGGTLTARGRIGGGGAYNSSYYTGIGGAGGNITINGGVVTSTMDLGSATDATSYGSIRLAGGSLTTPSISMTDGKVSFTQSITLIDNFTASQSVSIADSVTVSLDGGANFNVNKKTFTLGESASVTYLNAPKLNSDNYYEIYTVAQMRWFRDLVNDNLIGTEKNINANGKLMADIDLKNESWTPIGMPYQGKFDGNYHTISNLYVNAYKGSRGLFGATFGYEAVNNLGIINAKVVNCEYAGVFVGRSFMSTLWNCWSAGDLELSATKGYTSGIANTEDKGSLTNCHTTYSILTANSHGEDPTITNCTDNMRSDAYKTGELAYILNTNKVSSEARKWGQIIGTDEHPVALVDGVNNVYQYGKVQDATTLTLGTTETTNRMTTLCFPHDVTLPEKVMAFTVTGMDGKNITMSKLDASVVPACTPVILLNTGTTEATVSLPATNGIFTNSATTGTIISQTGNLLMGTCDDLTSLTATQYGLENSSFAHTTTLPTAYQCYLDYDSGADTYTPAIAQYLEYPIKNSEGYYEIYNATQLKWYRDYANSSDETVNGKLMADIDLNYEAWTPMGKPHDGAFDGNYHTINNLYVNNGDARGLFGYVQSSVKNLGVVNAKISDGGTYAGVIAAFASTIKMQNCWSAGVIDLPSTGDYVSGIANTGSGGELKNCHTSYSTISKTAYGDDPTITNCTANLPSDAYETGELAYMLDSNMESDETGWGQTIGTDKYPVALTETNKVYRHGMPQEAKTLELKVSDRLTTLCFPEDVTLPEKVMAFTVTGIEESSTDEDCGHLIINKIESSVVLANTPVILMNTGTETANVPLSALKYRYSNDATVAPIISQEGNLLKGTCSQLDLSNTQYNWYNRLFTNNADGTRTVPIYQCYIEIENGKKNYYLETSEPLGDIEYTILSEGDKTCYISRLFYAGIGKSDYHVTIPSTTQIDGVNYKVVQLGLGTDDDDDDANFVNMNFDNNRKLYINLPKSIKTVSKQILDTSLEGNSCFCFTSEKAPVFKGPKDIDHYSAKVYVPYAAENVYKSAWGNDHLEVSIRKTEVDIANGQITINADSYTQGGTTTAIDGTLVIKGTSTSNLIYINECGTEEEPMSIAINGLSIDLTQEDSGMNNEEPAVTIKSGANISLIVQDENSLTCLPSIPSIKINDGGSFIISSLSTGTLYLSGGVSGGNIGVFAKAYNGSSNYTFLDIKDNTRLNTDNNELAFTDYTLVIGIDNLVTNGKCHKFILNDAIDVYSPSDFTANEVTYRRTFSDNDFNSLYLPFNVSVDDFKDCEFYIINMFHQDDTDGDGVLDAISLEVNKVPSGSILRANHPYLFKYTGTTFDDALEFTMTDVDVKATESATFECSSMTYKYEFTGNFQGKTAEEYADYYVIGVDATSGKTALVHPTGQLPAMRWAMKMTARESQLVSTPAEAPAKVSIIIKGENDATGISSVESDTDINTVYGVSGVRKSTITKGLNILKTKDGHVTKIMKR